MSDLALVSIPNGQFVQNCYLLADPDTGGAVIIDPGEEPDRFLAELDRRGWRLGGIWLTHAHLDHILGIAAVQEATGAPVWLHPEDRPLYDALPDQARMYGYSAEPAPAPEHELTHDHLLRVGGHQVRVRATPGHSPGSVSFVVPGRIIGGDVLFQGSIGRTDLPGGNTAQLFDTIQREFLSLPDETIVHSGHGPDTTIGAERRSNPFLAGADAPRCNRCGFPVVSRAWGCKNPCPNCGTVYPLGDCSD